MEKDKDKGNRKSKLKDFRVRPFISNHLSDTHILSHYGGFLVGCPMLE